MDCKALNRTGAPCRMPARFPDGLCWSHDPENAERRRAASVRGGSARQKQVARATAPAKNEPEWFDLETAAQVESALRDVSQRLLRGKIGAREANATTTALRALLNSFDEADTELKIREELRGEYARRAKRPPA